MSRRSTPQAKIDEAAWPVRIRIAVPDMGFGRQLDQIYAWLNEHVGRSEYALHADGGFVIGGERLDRMAIYFRRADHADALLDAFPLSLADGTMSPTYSSPALPFGRRIEDEIVCNLYNQTTAVEAMRRLFPGISNRAGNIETGDVYPDRTAPIVTVQDGGPVLALARWGLPSPPQYHSPSGIDRGVTNVRNVGSPHWRRWLGPEHRCLVPVDRFAEPRGGRGAGNAWFQVPGGRQAFFAGIWVPRWTSIRKLRDGETTDDLFGFLTCPPNGVVAPIHPKAMPVVLIEPDDWQAWLQGAPAAALQRPLPDGSLTLVDDPM
ncbi:SOS response-associated peptidase [Pararhodobacter sp.]|uniref:SOS response-associated peptidase n=1 Tax=Pararhodobacter sp. TaxID=2127056 RepID=UPI002FE40415